jgi:hypothetical protein
MRSKFLTICFSLMMVMASHGAPARVSAVGPVTHWVAQTGVEVGTGASCEDPGYVGNTHAVVIEAIEAAAIGDTVHICAGIYLYGASGSVDIADDVTIEGDGPSHTILDGNGDWYLLSIDSAEDIAVKDLAVVNGYDVYGAGIYIDGSSFLIDNVRFDGNHAGTDGGGGLYAYQSNGVITNSEFHANSSEWGGAIVIDDSSLEVQDSTFTENYTDRDAVVVEPDYGGAAIYLYGGSLEVQGSTFADNQTAPLSSGAAIHVYAGSLVVDDSTFSNNRAMQGAAIYLYGPSDLDPDYDSASSVTITDSEFVRNRTLTLEDGGAIAHERSGRDVTISGNAFTRNSGASYGGAIEAWLVFGALEISRNHFTGNSAEEGGALWIDVRNGVADITGNRFKGNRARTGGAISFECEAASARSVVSALTRSNRYSGNSARTPRSSSNVWASRYVTSAADCD